MKQDEKDHMKILLVEDNENDIIIAQEAFEECGLIESLKIVKTGEEATRYLHDKDKVKPHIILLDINLPNRSGIEILKEIKKDTELKVIPVIIFTTSKLEKDIIKCYQNHANCYISKPLKMQDFIKIINSIKDFWLTLVEFPY